MYTKSNRAALIAQIGAINKPKITEGKSIDFGGIVDAYYKGKDIAAKNEQKDKMNALASALQSGDEEAINKAAIAYNPQAFYDATQRIKETKEAEDRQFARQKELAAINNTAAMERARLTYGNSPGLGKGEFGSLLNFRNSDAFNSLPVEQQERLDSRLAYLSNNPELGYEQAYQKKRGSKQAESEFEKAANAYAAGQRAGNLQDVLSTVQNMDRIMFTPAGAVQAKIGQLGDVFGWSSAGGMSEDERTQRAMIDRAITDIGQDLIARAKSKGQAGINTLGEIERIVGNLSMTKGRAELVGALQELIKQEQKLNALETVATPIPTAPANNSTQTVGGFKVRVIGG